MNLISPREAEALILSQVSVLGEESVPLEDALGRILRENLFADRSFPPFDRVTMDGIAFRVAELNGQPLSLQGIHAAGNPTPPLLKNGHCWQVMTGSIMPPDCDTIVPYEEVTIADGTAAIQGEAISGKFIHRQGSDAPVGALVIKAGTKIAPAHLGMMASIGASSVKVSVLPRIKILTTGDELVPVTQTPLPHQLRQSNGQTLLSAVQQWGPATVSWEHLADELAATILGISSALAYTDLVIISGGISKGKKDYVRPALESLRGSPTFHGVAQRPGKPLAAWPGVIALPGNPNSTLTTFHRYLIPLLEKMIGMSPRIAMNLPLATPVEQHPFLTQFPPAKLNSEGRALSLSPQNSGDFITPLASTGYLEIPPGKGKIHTARFFQMT